MIFPINTTKNPDQYKILKTPALPVIEITAIEREFISSLAETCVSFKHCVGLAANQVWINKDVLPPAIFVARVLPDRSKCLVCINPTIIKKWGSRKKVTEGCLSKSRDSRLWRQDRIDLNFLDEFGINQSLSFVGFGAQIIQHECNHLQGILI